MKNMQKSIQTSSKIPFEIHLKNDAGKYWKISTKIPPTLRFRGPILEPVAWLFPGVARFFADLFFGTSAGTPKNDFGYLLEGFWPPWARLNPPLWNDVGIQRRFLVHPPFPRTCLSSETVGQIRKCYSNTSQTHDAIKAFNKSRTEEIDHNAKPQT